MLDEHIENVMLIHHGEQRQCNKYFPLHGGLEKGLRLCSTDISSGVVAITEYFYCSNSDRLCRIFKVSRLDMFM
ncbi:CLUMA_CG010247, isoform A [Clunio marinus]|uniref:CLUMA_CG010247, isoform A n=1 Tax=Clunio marinus TaxID=568069 RepID=A0A1J1ICM5_9DIPT|nr:CLUMA_CG010247, isoform A [Clunio marinus]